MCNRVGSELMNVWCWTERKLLKDWNKGKNGWRRRKVIWRYFPSVCSALFQEIGLNFCVDGVENSWESKHSFSLIAKGQSYGFYFIIIFLIWNVPTRNTSMGFLNLINKILLGHVFFSYWFILLESLANANEMPSNKFNCPFS